MPAPLEVSHATLVTLGREWLAGAPEAGPINPDLNGWVGDVGFVCSTCAGRIMARGCQFKLLATRPVWNPAPAAACNLCNAVV